MRYLLLRCSAGSIKNNRDRARLYRLVEFIGRWSMLDVFVDTFVVALVQLQPLHVGAGRSWRSVLHGGGGADHARGAVLRPAPDLGLQASRWQGPPWLRTPTSTACHAPRSFPGGACASPSVWIIPILAALVAVGIAIQRILSEGPTITIIFQSAEGIEAGKTFIKYKDVNIGQVTAVQLSEDYGKVEVTAKIAKSAAGLMVEDAQFWVVRPRITLSGISGLDTLLSGNYIGFERGQVERASAHLHRARGAADRHRRSAGPASSC